jgi:two-component system CheB/CheR fusion protein
MPLPKNLICVGASAGGLQAVTDLLHYIPEEINNHIAVVLAQHLSPTYKSRLTELLSRETRLKVVETISDQKLEAGKMYICPPDREIYVEKEMLHLTKSPIGIGPKPSVDSFISSVTTEWASKTIAVILSGTGSDGSRGVEDLSDRGGIVMVQHPKSAKYDGMPQAAISTNLVDYIGTPKEIASQIKAFVESGQLSKQIVNIQTQDKDKSAFYQILRLLSQRTGTDFSNYKSATINRRLEKRLAYLQIASLDKYIEYCQKHPKEIDALFDSVLIGVTEFFRDYPVFVKLKEELEERFKDDKTVTPVRVWVPGCATGEEAYSIAMVIAEVLGIEMAQKRVQIFASDIDEVALKKARAGIYTADKLEKLPDLYRKYLKPKNNNQYQVSQDIKSFILFSKHDVTSNPPFLKLDLISCRNLLIYFGLDLQKHVLPVFHYSLKPNSILLLGKSETTGNFQDHFSTIDSKLKLYRKKKLASGEHKQIQNITKLTKREFIAKEVIKPKRTLTELVKNSYFSQSIHPVVIINEDMDILEIVGDINDYVRIKPGQMTANLVQQAVEGLQIEVRSAILKAIKSNATFTSRFRKLQTGSAQQFVRIIVKPVIDEPSNYEALLTVEFESIAEDEIGLRSEVNPSENEDNNERIIELERELSATKEDLQSYVEELETANEELQSLNEELQSSNEELQSTNEELETSNEELQSTNEEVQIAYAELAELNTSLVANEVKLTTSQQHLSALLDNTMQVYVMITSDYRIVTFNQRAVETFKDLFDKVLQIDKSLLDYLSDDALQSFFDNFRRALKGEIIKEDLKLQNRSGIEKHFFINLHPVKNDEGDIREVVIGLLDVTDKVLATQALTKAEKLNQSIYKVLGTAIVVSNKDQMIVEVNDSFSKTFGYSKKQAIDNHINLVVSGTDRKAFEKRYKGMLKSGETQSGLLTTATTRKGDILIVKTQSSVIEYENNQLVVTSIENITDISQANQKLEDQKQELKIARHNLEERIKEQRAVMEIAILANSQNPVNTLLETATGIIQQGFEHPEAAGILIQYQEDKYTTKGYRNKKNQHISAPLLIENKKVGYVEMCYQKQMNGKYPEILKEEIEMIQAIANLLSQILENRQLNAEIANNENFLKSTFASVHDGISIIDNDGNHIMVNEGLIKMTGYSEKELINSTVPHLYWPEEEYDTIQKAFADAVGEKGASYELTFKRRNGERFPVLVSPSKIELEGSEENYMIGWVQDITEKKNKELEIIRSESNYRFLYENTLDMVCNHDSEGKYLAVSPSCQRITGYKPKDLIGKSIVDFCHEEDRDKFPLLVPNKRTPDDVAQKVQYRYRHSEGHYVWMETYNKVILGKDNQVKNILSSTRDITHQKLQQAQLSSLINALKTSNEELKEFAYVASHDLQEPLRMISSFTQMLDEKYRSTLEEEAIEYIDFVVDGSKRLQQMIEDLLQYSRVNTQAIKLEEVSSKKVVEEVMQLLDHSIKEKEAKITFKNLPKISVVPGLFQRLMMNLIQNALKYSKDAPPTVEISAVEEQNYWRFSVKDNGIGIAPEFFDKIFVIFKRLHGQDTHEGTGIGLSICKRIVLKHGGRIWVESKKDEGATFFFTLPKEAELI